MRFLLVIAATMLCACPGFEDKFSGTYQQRITADTEPGTEPISLEVFRYGHNVHAMVRYYEGGLDPFGNEMRCQWTNATTLDDDSTFDTILKDANSQVRLFGRFEDNGTFIAKFDGVIENSPDLVLDLVDDTPDDTCRTIPARNVRAKFSNLGAPNEFEPGEYDIKNPYLGIQWIAVQRIQTGSVGVWTAFTPELITVPMQSKVTANGRGLTGEYGLDIVPPDDDYWTLSGDTRYSLAHFIVVDDDPDDETFVSWDRETEPIIASGVRGGTRADAPAVAADHDSFGRALLFVEGRLDSLGRMLEIIELVEEDVNGDGVIDKVDPTAHYYVAEVFAEDERIVGMRISPSAGALAIPVTITTEYLEEIDLPLPRLFPE